MNTANEQLVDELVRRLRAEHARAGRLDNDRVLRVTERRNVPPEVVSAVRQKLTELGLLAGTKKAAEVEGWKPTGSDDDEAAGTRFDILGQYLDELARYPLLVSEDEVVLGRRIRAARERLESIVESLADSGLAEQQLDRLFLRQAARRLPLDELDRRLLLDGADAEDQLYKSNLRLVVSVARRTYWNHPKLDPLDIVQAGNLGLVRAVQLFDHRSGYKFSTYATWWIRQAIERHVADTGRTIRLPVHVVDSLRKLRRARHALAIELGREPTLHEISDWTGETPERIQFLTDVARTTASLDAPLADGSGGTLGDLVPDERAEDPQEVVARHMLREAVMDALDHFSEREKRVVVMRFGLNAAGRPHTLQEIADEFGVTRERIRQIEVKTLKKLGARLCQIEVKTAAQPRNSARSKRQQGLGNVVPRPPRTELTDEERIAAATDRVLDYAAALPETAGVWALEFAVALLEGEEPPPTPDEPWAARVHAEVSKILGDISSAGRDDRAQSRLAGRP